MGFTRQNLQSLVQVAVQNAASDIHIRMDETPAFRIRGELVPVQTKPFSTDDISDLLTILLSETIKPSDLEKLVETDGSYEIENLSRLRFNSFRYSGKTGVVLRLVSMQVPSVSGLGLPKVIQSIADRRRGLVLVTGATGSGKSTTLAAMIDHINETRGCHIVTIEDPVEFLH
ncbi:MAG: type IV pili twitching motility protein PilT, partial [Halobacteriovorax sp.]|nr:type IV pili twitching motility protein PilT [Halobacteriovorax sp.]